MEYITTKSEISSGPTPRLQNKMTAARNATNGSATVPRAIARYELFAEGARAAAGGAMIGLLIVLFPIFES
jgi:hypothetical protein